MNVNDFMVKHNLNDSDLDRMAAPYEEANFESKRNRKIFSGSHLDAVGAHRVAVTYSASDTQEGRDACSP